ncbi:MAG: hypothetical protein AW07_01165 [Candidatus Accumulibacter sp. SK-11]|nr:MAG: hypothetical protein AW07_01165 [Candidatus Accumulibacter sp. SK-11]
MTKPTGSLRPKTAASRRISSKDSARRPFSIASISVGSLRSIAWPTSAIVSPAVSRTARSAAPVLAQAAVSPTPGSTARTTSLAASIG